MSNGGGNGGPRPPEIVKVECKVQGHNIAYFEGAETAPDAGDEVALVVLGNSEYFHVGTSYEVVFKPL